MSIITFSDVHWGAHGQDAQALYEELTIIKQAILEEDTKLVVMCGDYYDRKIDFTSDAAVLSIKFMNELREACRIKGAILRFIRGTRSHDLNQLNNFKSFETGDGMFRVIDTVGKKKYCLDLKFYISLKNIQLITSSTTKSFCIKNQMGTMTLYLVMVVFIMQSGILNIACPKRIWELPQYSMKKTLHVCVRIKQYSVTFINTVYMTIKYSTMGHSLDSVMERKTLKVS